MPQVSRTTPLVTAQAGASAPWGDASIGGNLQATLKAELRHGLAVDIGLGAFVDVSGELSRFFSVEAAGEAHAEVRLTGQAQVPLNLFEEIGLAVRLKASAEAAAGVSLRVGVNVGDFLDLIEGDLGLEGLPPRLAAILLEEATFGGGVYAKAAAAAMAYANLVVACRAVQGPTPQEKPGFSVLAEMGAGLKAGAGVRVFFDAPVDNFSRLVQRMVDAVVDEVAAGVRDAVTLTATEEDALVDVFRVVAKTAFRVAYETGVLLGTPPGVAQDATGARTLALRCAQVIQEEIQRVVLDAGVRGALIELQRQVAASLDAASTTSDVAAASIEALADTLDAMPDEPLSVDAQAYWTGLFTQAVDVMQRLAGATPPASLVAPAATAWAALALLRHAIRRLNDPAARASFSVVNLTAGQVENPFTGPLPGPPPPALVSDHIRTRLTGSASGGALRFDDLVAYLAGEGLDLAAPHVPVIARLKALVAEAGQVPATQGLAVLLSQVGATVRNASGAPDERATLAALLGALRAAIDGELRARLYPLAGNALREAPELKLYFEEAIVPSIDAAFTLLVERAATWDSTSMTATAYKELASSIVLGVLGRSLVIFGDGLTTLAAAQLRDALEEAADTVVESGLRDVLAPLTGGTAAEDVAELAEDALRVAAAVFGPLPDGARQRIRQAMFQIVAPLPPSAQAPFAAQLADALFVPNQAALDTLRDELAAVAAERFLLFVQGLLAKLAERFLAFVEEVIRTVQELVTAFVAFIDGLVRQLSDLVSRLLGEIAVLQERIDQALLDLGTRYDALFGALADDDARARLSGAVADAIIDRALDVLADNPIYKGLPGDVKTTARSTVRELIRDAVDQEWIGDIARGLLDAKGTVDDFVEEVRDLEPGDGLVSGIAGILLGRMEDAVTLILPGGGIAIPIGFDIEWDVDVPYFDIGRGRWRTAHYEYRQRIALGRIEIGLGGVWSVLADVVLGVQVVEQAVNQLAGKVEALLLAELDHARKSEEAALAAADKGHAETQQRDAAQPLTGVRIVTPAAGRVVQSDTTLEIELDAAPLSWLGLGDQEQARVLVFLNDDVLDLRRFEVRQSQDGLIDRLHYTPGSLVGAWGQRVALPPDRLLPVKAEGRRVRHRGAAAPMARSAKARRRPLAPGIPAVAGSNGPRLDLATLLPPVPPRLTLRVPAADDRPPRRRQRCGRRRRRPARAAVHRHARVLRVAAAARQADAARAHRPERLPGRLGAAQEGAVEVAARSAPPAPGEDQAVCALRARADVEHAAAAACHARRRDGRRSAAGTGGALVSPTPSPVVKVARHIAKLLRLLLSVKRRPAMPAGASIDPAFAETIAADAARLDAARTYWRLQLGTWGGTADVFASPAGRLADAAVFTPSGAVSGVRNGLRRRIQYQLDGAVNLVKDELAPLLSLTEIARHVAETAPTPIATTSADVLRADVAALLDGPAGQPAADVAAVGRGLRCARELLDVAKRIALARNNYRAHLTGVSGASFAEPLSLHWNEGSFAVAPSWRSYTAGPLILALPRTPNPNDAELGGYRVANVIYNAPVIRPGFIVYHGWKSTWTTAADARGDLCNANLMTLGGLDNVLLWKPRSAGTDQDHTKDELWRVLTTLFSRRGFGTFDHRVVYGFCLADLEIAAGEPTTVGLDLAIARTGAVYTVEAEPVPDAATRAFAAVREEDDARNTANGLDLASRWYASRRTVRTLLAWRDRTNPLFAGEFLSPYLTYLRYHQGDVLFMRTLMSTLRGLAELERSWDRLLRTASRRAAFDAAQANLLTHLAASGWADAANRNTLTVLGDGLLAEWSTSTVRYRPTTPAAETAWRHIGLIARMRAASPADPVLAAIGSAPADAPLTAVADTALVFVEAMSAYSMWPVLDAALQVLAHPGAARCPRALDGSWRTAEPGRVRRPALEGRELRAAAAVLRARAQRRGPRGRWDLAPLSRHSPRPFHGPLEDLHAPAQWLSESRGSIRVASMAPLVDSTRPMAHAYGIGVPSASVPAAHTTPPASEYIARSTTIGTGVASMLSISAPKPRPAAAGNSLPTGTLKRELAGTVNVLATAAAPSSISVTRTVAGWVVVFAIRK